MADTAQHFLLPGALYAAVEPTLVQTVLGSCVAVCLWDMEHKFGGINHYKLPLWNGDGLPSPKFGNIAVEKLVERLLDLGSDRRRLVAKVFGGAAVIESTGGLLNVGERNIEAARALLQEQRIPIIAGDVGGDVSRKLMFQTWDNTVLMKKARAR
ncbi:MAG: chemotaxis protein CheD [Magnetococcus sp. WYHC-3]